MISTRDQANWISNLFQFSGDQSFSSVHWVLAALLVSFSALSWLILTVFGGPSFEEVSARMRDEFVAFGESLQ